MAYIYICVCDVMYECWTLSHVIKYLSYVFYLLCAVKLMICVVVFVHVLFIMVGKLQVGFQDVAFLPSRASCYATFLKHCGGG